VLTLHIARHSFATSVALPLAEIWNLIEGTPSKYDASLCENYWDKTYEDVDVFKDNLEKKNQTSWWEYKWGYLANSLWSSQAFTISKGFYAPDCFANNLL
jgi:hypothetical protein